ncbi:MAG: amylo-alpha-1,6-glucosidase [Candidatus Hydrothermarchaeales archaeon]
MNSDVLKLASRAKAVLEKNWNGNYTRPSIPLYPHQWNWDSGFIAIGYSTYNQDKAQLELASLFNAQWKNGMVPHTVFNPEVPSGYFPGAGFWDSSRSENAPDRYHTSGITQPPIHATAALRIYERAKDKEKAHAFLEQIYPKLVTSHRFFYKERDPKKEGLVYIRHPWESGIDNSPNWDIPLRKMSLEEIPSYKRKDLKKGIPAEQRPGDEDYDRYISLLELFKKHDYHEASILEECPFLIQDTLVNAILVNANHDLAQIGEILGIDTSEIKDWEKKTKKAMNRKLWHRGHGIYDDYDLKADSMIEIDTATGFTPMYAGIPSKSQAQRLYDYLDSNSFCHIHNNRCFSVPNYNMEGEYFEPVNYWRGPIWININWMLQQGLQRYGFNDKAERIREDIIELVRRFGFYEYFDPIKGKGYGSKNFSWTAALLLDVIYEQKHDTEQKSS